MDNKNEKTEEVIEIKEASANEEANADIKQAAVRKRLKSNID